MSGTTYVLAFQGPSSRGFIATFKITTDGATITKLKELNHDTSKGTDHRIQKMSDNTFVIVYNSSSTTLVKTFKVDTDGTITEIGPKETIYDGKINTPAITMIDADTYLSLIHI